MTISTWGEKALASARGRFAAARLKRQRAAQPTFASALVEDHRPASQSLPQFAEPEKLRFAGLAFVAVGAVLLGFAAQFIGISQVSYARDQQLALTDFRYQLANATAPVGQVGQDGKLLALGTPVAVIDVPSIGMSGVVLEGTTSDVMMSGAGHRRDTPLPGQAGASVVFGRQMAFGGPFSSISQLVPGDKISATTGQGVSTYEVIDVRYPGDPVPDRIGAGEGRLTLVSADGLPFFPSTVVRVDAKLTSDAQPTPERVLTYAAISAPELAMAGNTSALPLLLVALIMLVLLVALFTISRRLWGVWQTWIVAVPVLFAIGLLAARQVASILPNLM